MTNKGGWIGVDLDGTLAKYDGWKGVDHIGEPVPAMQARVKEWRAAGIEVRIFTARVSAFYERTATTERINDALHALQAINQWCQRHLGAALPVTALKDYAMIELYDDRCHRVEINTGRIIGDA